MPLKVLVLRSLLSVERTIQRAAGCLAGMRIAFSNLAPRGRVVDPDSSCKLSLFGEFMHKPPAGKAFTAWLELIFVLSESALTADAAQLTLSEPPTTNCTLTREGNSRSSSDSRITIRGRK